MPLARCDAIAGCANSAASSSDDAIAAGCIRAVRPHVDGVPIAHDLMASFAERTGLTGSRPQRRYLWTDAFAVCNFLGLGQVDLALRLVEHVHHELGRHRSDGVRRGWISGLADAPGAAHPTIGGLRIGKPLAERGPDEPFDDRLEWDRDGQYFHYLTKWMHSLARVAHAAHDAKFATWGLELAKTAHQRFVHETRGRRHMYWKMSVDLRRPQVGSMGQHDPVDGYITGLELDATAKALGLAGPDLGDVAADYRAMIEESGLVTADPLGIGGLLVDAHRLTQLDRDRPLRDVLVRAAGAGLARYVRQPDLRMSASHRLAFRELGLAIGLAAAREMNVGELARYAELRAAIESFWLDPDHRRSPTYLGHEDINDVMLATCVEPKGFLSLVMPAHDFTGPPEA